MEIEQTVIDANVSVLPDYCANISTGPPTRRCYLVLGPEGSGTYMMAESFESVGITYVDGEITADKLRNIGDDVVIRRSLPHAGERIDIKNLVVEIRKADYDVYVFIMTRDSLYCAYSVSYRKQKQTDEDSLLNVAEAYRTLLDIGCEWYSVVIPYEKFVTDAVYRANVFSTFGLPAPTIEYYNANDKYRN